jgi:CubicO group peptidase (beta-lactamase class C family)
MLDAVREHLRGVAGEMCGSGRVPGYLAGVYHAGEQVIVANGVSNIATGDAMSEDAGFLAGSITKVMTATLMLQCVERGEVDLDERVTKYLPKLLLAPPAKIEQIRVRNLLNHTNGIDADLFWPDEVKGRDALKYFVGELRRCSMLFDPGQYVSYSNAGMLVAGRVLEVVTGRTYHDLLEQRLYEPVAMVDSCTSPEQAILRRTAVGHSFDPKTGKCRRTDMFMLPESWSACGSTPIVTVSDLLAFARTHLDDGVSPTGKRVLSGELTRQMRTITVDMGSPDVSPLGLGWPFIPFGDETVLFHGGASPGGAAILLVVPRHKFAFVAFGNSGAAALLHDKSCLWMLRDYLGLQSANFVTTPVPASDLDGYAGTYRSNQFRVDVKPVDGQLEETMTLEPFDEAQARSFSRFGGLSSMPPRRLVPVGDGLFAPTGVPLETFNGLVARRMLVSFHGGTKGRPEYRMSGGKMARRALEARSP